jgi:hypothetical protein
VPSSPRHDELGRADPAEGLPGPLRRSHRRPAAPMPAVPARPIAGGCNPAAIAVSICGTHRFHMIRCLILTCDPSAWQCRCGVEVWTVGVHSAQRASDNRHYVNSRRPALTPAPVRQEMRPAPADGRTRYNVGAMLNFAWYASPSVSSKRSTAAGSSSVTVQPPKPPPVMRAP